MRLFSTPVPSFVWYVIACVSSGENFGWFVGFFLVRKQHSPPGLSSFLEWRVLVSGCLHNNNNQNGGRRGAVNNEETEESEKCFNWSHWKRSEYKIIEACRWTPPLATKGTVYHSQNQITNINVFCVAPMRCAIWNDLFWLNHSICYFSPTSDELSDNFLFGERRKCVVYFNLRAGRTILFLRGWRWGVGNC